MNDDIEFNSAAPEQNVLLDALRFIGDDEDEGDEISFKQTDEDIGLGEALLGDIQDVKEEPSAKESILTESVH